jgi:hypothetical protein
VGIEGYIGIVSYEDGRPPERYLLASGADVAGLYGQRMAEGRTEPIGSAWGSTLEIWAVAGTFCFRFYPVFRAMRLARYLTAAEFGRNPDESDMGFSARIERGGG